MFIEGDKLYWVLVRCNDLFPDWEDMGDFFRNKKTGETVSPIRNIVNENIKYFNYSDYCITEEI